MVHSDSYLYLSRHNIYYFRAIVPDGIKDDLHKLEYRRSTQTRSLSVARNMGRLLRVCFETNLDRLRANVISWDELRKILDKELDRFISVEQAKLKKEGPYPLAADDIWKEHAIPNYNQAIDAITELRTDRMSGESSGSIPEFAETLAETLLNKSNIQLDKSSGDVPMLLT